MLYGGEISESLPVSEAEPLASASGPWQGGEGFLIQQQLRMRFLLLAQVGSKVDGELFIHLLHL